MTPLSFSKASMLMCSFLELRKSSISLITSASLMPIASSAVMTSDLWRRLTSGLEMQLVKLHKKERVRLRLKFKPYTDGREICKCPQLKGKASHGFAIKGVS